jgi:hypothetical protein
MKEKTAKRKSELLRLYGEGAALKPKFKIRNAAARNTQPQNSPSSPITSWELLRSLLLTFVIVFIQWLISSIVL